VKSTDEEIVHYFTAHHDQILAAVKEKALALGVLKPSDLDHLDMHAKANGWCIGLKFGTKAATDTDPATHQKLTPVELANKMTESPLASIDTKKLGEIFTDVLLSAKELPPITPRILDPHMVKELLNKRMGADPTVAAVIAKHDMFKTEDEVKAAVDKEAKSGLIPIGEPSTGTAANGKPVVELSFRLPVGVKPEDALRGIIANRSQLLLSAQPASQGFAAGVAT
jgi:hypothetical protein